MTLSTDRVGLVALVSDFITSRGGNIEDSRMAQLGSEFGLMLLVSGTAEQLARIESDTPRLDASPDMSVLIRRTRERKATGSTGTACLIKVGAMDHEGIVLAVARAIQQMDINIEALQTWCYHAPNSGAPLFRLEAKLRLPPNRDLTAVRERLALVAEEERLDIEVLARGDTP